MTSAKIKIDVDDSQLNAKLKQQAQNVKESFRTIERSGSGLSKTFNNIGAGFSYRN